MRPLVVLSLAALVVLAGCGQMTDLGDGTRKKTVSPSTETTTPTGTLTTTETTRTVTNVDFDTDRIILTLSELPDAYTIEGETFERRNQTTDETLTKMRELEMQVVHERAFVTSSGDYPQYVFASVTVYDSPDAAAAWLDDHLDQLRASGGSLQSRTVTDDVEATEVRFVNDDGLKAVALYERQADVVFYVAVSGKSYRIGFAGQLFGKMVAELPEG